MSSFVLQNVRKWPYSDTFVKGARTPEDLVVVPGTSTRACDADKGRRQTYAYRQNHLNVGDCKNGHTYRQ